VADGLLLLHAWPIDRRMWDPQLAAVPEGLALAVPNHPGFGGAPSDGEVTTMASCAATALAAMDDAGIDRAMVCGISVGGYVAFELWRRSRERVAGLLLSNTRAVADAPEGAAARRALAGRLRAEGNVLATDPPPLLAEDAPEELREHVRRLIADQSAEAIAALAIGMAERPDSTPDLPTIDVPTLVVTGEGDRLIPPDVTASMAEAIPGARLEVLEGAGHLPNLEATERFDRLLIEHLEASGIR
jgi:pimeloyl-ACP methyl ester carboxylesterase